MLFSSEPRLNKPNDYDKALKEMDDAIAKAVRLAPDLRKLGWHLEEKANQLARRFAVESPVSSVTRPATRIGA